MERQRNAGQVHPLVSRDFLPFPFRQQVDGEHTGTDYALGHFHKSSREALFRHIPAAYYWDTSIRSSEHNVHISLFLTNLSLQYRLELYGYILWDEQINMPN